MKTITEFLSEQDSERRRERRWQAGRRLIAATAMMAATYLAATWIEKAIAQAAYDAVWSQAQEEY